MEERDIQKPAAPDGKISDSDNDSLLTDQLSRDTLNMKLIIYGVTGEFEFSHQLTQGQKLFLPHNAITIPLKDGGMIVRIPNNF